MKHIIFIILLLFCLQPSLVSQGTSTTAFLIYDVNCGSLKAEIWNKDKGWHQGTCKEIAEKLNEARDVRWVTFEYKAEKQK